MGLKVTLMASVAVSFGGVVGLSAAVVVAVKVLMKNSIVKLGVW